MKQQMYYIQDSREYVGNCMSFWGKNGGRYVCQIEKAGLYTYEEAMSQFKSRNTDIPWKQQDIECAVKSFVDHQYVKKDPEDPFYIEVEKIQNEHIEKERLSKLAEKEAQISQELEWILESIELSPVYSSEVKDSDDFEIKLNDVKSDSKYEYPNPYYFPFTYSLEPDVIFDKLIEHNLIFRCSSCKSYFNTLCKDEEYITMCDHCGEEQYYKDIPDD